MAMSAQAEGFTAIFSTPQTEDWLQCLQFMLTNYTRSLRPFGDTGVLPKMVLAG